MVCLCPPHSVASSLMMCVCVCVSILILTEILKGGVKMAYNPLLCNTETIQWWDILDKSTNPTMLFKVDTFDRKCM